ncbi:reverse transcriptase [Phytophthora megakarya]|uniref:Reverse transcriptase n=1 Tax=Phytophthora megakarya TaxID=4795 RepID=A0A225WKE7_9STRA|nr:reverse transcriptase [Phytophthora megakarya]
MEISEYYLIVPRLREFDPPKSERVCAIDLGVRKFNRVQPQMRPVAAMPIKIREEKAIPGQGKMAIQDRRKEAGRDRRVAAVVRPEVSSDYEDHRATAIGRRLKTTIVIADHLDQDPDLEEKPRIPLMAAPVDTADIDESLDPYTTDKEVTKLKSNSSTKSATATRLSKKKKLKAAQTKLKAPDSESEDVNKPRSTAAKARIEQAYYRKILSETRLHDPVLAIIQVRQIGDLTGPISKPSTSSNRLNAVKILLDLLHEAGLVAGEFDPGSLFEMELGAIQAATQDLFDSLKILVGEHVQTPDLNYQIWSSHNASATSEPDLDSPRAPQRMSLGPSGAKYLRSRVINGRNRLDEYFQMAMNRFLKEQILVTVQPPPLGTQDIDMESVARSCESLPGWEVVKARSGYLESLTVNEAEYNGLLLGLDMLEDIDRKRIRGWPEHQDLVTLNRVDEILIPKTENPVVRIAAVTTQASREEGWITGMKKYLSDSIADLTQAEARSYGKIGVDYEVDEQDLLFYCPPTPRSGNDRDRLLRLVAGGDPGVAGKNCGGFGPRVVSFALQTANLLLQDPNLLPGLGSFLAQTIAICLGMVKILAGGNRMTLEVVALGAKLKNLGAEAVGIFVGVVGEVRDLDLQVGDLFSLAVLERFHVPDVGSELANLQIKNISILDEAIPREVALAELDLQGDQPPTLIGGVGALERSSSESANCGMRPEVNQDETDQATEIPFQPRHQVTSPKSKRVTTPIKIREEKAIPGQGKMAIQDRRKEAGRDRRVAAVVRPEVSSDYEDHRATAIGRRLKTTIVIADRDRRSTDPR